MSYLTMGRRRRGYEALGPAGRPVHPKNVVRAPCGDGSPVREASIRGLGRRGYEALGPAGRPVHPKGLMRAPRGDGSPVRESSIRGLGRRGRGLGEDYLEPQLQVPDAVMENLVFRDESGKVVASYASPQEKVLKTAYTQGQLQLPAFYNHPQLGPWGVDPNQAFQYWAAQQQAMLAATAMFNPQMNPMAVATYNQQAMNPMAVWGSPYTAVTPGPVGPAPLTQAPAYNPYAQAYPEAGAAVERF